MQQISLQNMQSSLKLPADNTPERKLLIFNDTICIICQMH